MLGLETVVFLSTVWGSMEAEDIFSQESVEVSV
jgi:hypothetical protein